MESGVTPYSFVFTMYNCESALDIHNPSAYDYDTLAGHTRANQSVST